MRFHKLIARLTVLAAASLIGLAGCSDMGTGSLEMSSTEMANQTFQDETPDLLAGIDIEGAYEQDLLVDGVAVKPTGAKTKAINFAVTNEDDGIEVTLRRKWLIKSALVSADEPTIIPFGTDKVGYSSLEIPAGAVDEDVVFTIVHKLKGKRDLFFFPEGIDFNKPITLHFSLEGLNQRQLDYILSLQLFYHNPVGGGWQLIDSYSDGDFVHATLEHFSRYAVGSNE